MEQGERQAGQELSSNIKTVVLVMSNCPPCGPKEGFPISHSCLEQASSAGSDLPIIGGMQADVR